MSIGSSLKRAELYSTDSGGKRVRGAHKHAIGYTVMPVKETPSHALSYANTVTTDEQLELERREREARTKFDALSAVDHEILRLHLVVTGARDHVATFPREQREQLEQAGWYFRKETSRGARVEMVRSFVGKLTYDEIGRRVHLSGRTVQRRLSSMDPAMVKFAELRGWAT
jgi:hypothetical protein